MSTEFPVGSTFEVVAGMKNTNKMAKQKDNK
jgi:hypothetical protein